MVKERYKGSGGDFLLSQVPACFKTRGAEEKPVPASIVLMNLSKKRKGVFYLAAVAFATGAAADTAGAGAIAVAGVL